MSQMQHSYPTPPGNRQHQTHIVTALLWSGWCKAIGCDERPAPYLPGNAQERGARSIQYRLFVCLEHAPTKLAHPAGSNPSPLILNSVGVGRVRNLEDLLRIGGPISCRHSVQSPEQAQQPCIVCRGVDYKFD